MLLDEASYSPSMPNLILTTKKLGAGILNSLFPKFFPNNEIYPNKLLLEIIKQSEELLIRKMLPEITCIPQCFQGPTEFLGSAIMGDVLLVDVQLISFSVADELFVLQTEIRNQKDDLLCKSSKTRKNN